MRRTVAQSVPLRLRPRSCAKNESKWSRCQSRSANQHAPHWRGRSRRKCAHAQPQNIYVAIQRWLAVFGKQEHLLFIACALVEDADRLLPRPMLRIAQFTKIEHMAVDCTRASDAARFHNRPRTVFFSVLLANTALQKHVVNSEGKRNDRPEGRSPLQGFFQTPSLIINGLRGPQATKKAFSTANSGSRATSGNSGSSPGPRCGS